MKTKDSNKISSLKRLVDGSKTINAPEPNQSMTVIPLDPTSVAMLFKHVSATDEKLEKLLKKPSEFWLTHKEAQQFFGVSAQTLRSWRHAGFLSYHRVERNIMIKFSDIEIFLKNNRHEAFQYKK